MSDRPESFLVGLTGDGLMPSLTSLMHERDADVRGFRYLYRPNDLTVLGFPGSSVGDLPIGACRPGVNDLNITHPCKRLVLEHLDEVRGDP